MTEQLNNNKFPLGRGRVQQRGQLSLERMEQMRALCPPLPGVRNQHLLSRVVTTDTKGCGSRGCSGDVGAECGFRVEREEGT